MLDREQCLAMGFVDDDAERAMRSLRRAERRHVAIGACTEDDVAIACVVVGCPDLARLRVDVDTRLEFDVRLVTRDRALRCAGFGSGRCVLRPSIDKDLESALVGEHHFITHGVDRD